MNSPIPVILDPNTNPSYTVSWSIFSALINNQSNCWLTYNGQYIANPWQQLVHSFPAGDSAPQFYLTSTAPSGQNSQPNPQGQCYLQLVEESLAPNPGVIVSALPTLSQERLISKYLVAGNTTKTDTQGIQTGEHSVSFQTTAASQAVTLTGVQTGFVYASAVALTANKWYAVIVNPAADQTYTIQIQNGLASAATTEVTALPFNLDFFAAQGPNVNVNIIVNGNFVTDGFADTDPQTVGGLPASMWLRDGATNNRPVQSARQMQSVPQSGANIVAEGAFGWYSAGSQFIPIAVDSAGKVQIGSVNTPTRTIITNPTTSYTIPASCRAILVECIGGGGGGGGAGTAGASAAAGGGGGSGGYSSSLIQNPVGTAYPVSVGTGGAAGSSAPGSGGSGNNTTFNTTTVVANGGGGGAGGAAGTAVAITGRSGSITAGTGDIALPGAFGGPGFVFSGTVAQGGDGGQCVGPYGGPGGGGRSGTNPGFAGGNYGSGGGGGCVINGGSAQTGGAGANGVIVITEYY